ncbi:MAG: tRNA uridine(34) 5-carboxymethylaminomethyl modification radical SAM/GNAT enzyme Elp3 [Candidatus Magasanikbacteria bacterium]|nr:tRNA uridine(34) 5-carboxymethylaminomethyl modification radical SAM/GNAT enzyme Elp3 [Candidatus Magasanikbacteria bacterium]
MHTKKELEKILRFIISKKPQHKFGVDDAKRIIAGKMKLKQPSNRLLFAVYRELVEKKKIKKDKNLELFMRKADIRSLSGIAVVTSLVKPYSCPGKCIYCPTEKRMPKSYLASEPAAARALLLDFSPYEQMRRRIEALTESGHIADKIEFIIKGGTWNAYQIKYQYWFILESFRACNEYGKPKKEKVSLDSTLEELQEALEKEQRKNEKAKFRIIGLTLETRPDTITPKTIFHMRRQGCTRIELGLQAPDDKILELTKRGHTVEQFKKAMFLLRQAGFKVDLHFMPDLPGSSPQHDVEMYKSLFVDEALRPDMVKIYPCAVLKNTELYKWYKNKKYKPQNPKDLFESLIKMKIATPLYCRISRLIRDIPSTEITAGNSTTNLREMLKEKMAEKGEKCVCLRCREIGRHKELANEPPHLFVEMYETVGGKEYFISYETKNREALFGFLRLRIPEKTPKKIGVYKLLPEIKNCAFVRELHTYGQLVGIGKYKKNAAQHKGTGKKLMVEAEKIAKKEGYKKMAVISGVGVRGYYRKLGYRKVGTYMVRKI